MNIKCKVKRYETNEHGEFIFDDNHMKIWNGKWDKGTIIHVLDSDRGFIVLMDWGGFSVEKLSDVRADVEREDIWD